MKVHFETVTHISEYAPDPDAGGYLYREYDLADELAPELAQENAPPWEPASVCVPAPRELVQLSNLPAVLLPGEPSPVPVLSRMPESAQLAAVLGVALAPMMLAGGILVWAALAASAVGSGAWVMLGAVVSVLLVVAGTGAGVMAGDRLNDRLNGKRVEIQDAQRASLDAFRALHARWEQLLDVHPSLGEGPGEDALGEGWVALNLAAHELGVIEKDLDGLDDDHPRRAPVAARGSILHERIERVLAEAGALVSHAEQLAEVAALEAGAAVLPSEKIRGLADAATGESLGAAAEEMGLYLGALRELRRGELDEQDAVLDESATQQARG